MEVDEEEDCDGMGDCTGASATDQDENMVVDKVDQLVDNALKILVRNATEEFGFAPRDVYNGVFNLSRTRHEHFRWFRCHALQALVETFAFERRLHDPRSPCTPSNVWSTTTIGHLTSNPFGSRGKRWNRWGRKGMNNFGRRTTASTICQRVLLWRGGSSRRLFIAFSLLAGG